MGVRVRERNEISTKDSSSSVNPTCEPGRKQIDPVVPQRVEVGQTEPTLVFHLNNYQRTVLSEALSSKVMSLPLLGLVN